MTSLEPAVINQLTSAAPARCQHRTLKGRCRQPATDPAGTLCFDHARAHRQAKDDSTLLAALVRKPEDFASAEGINEDLAILHNLLAEGRISTRRASVIAYIDSLLLRTVLGIHQLGKDSPDLNFYGQPIRPFDYSSLKTSEDAAADKPAEKT